MDGLNTPEPLIAVIGIDIGDTTGMLLAWWNPNTWWGVPKGRHPVFARAWMCDRDASAELLGWILRDYGPSALEGPCVYRGGIEAFVLGPKARQLHGTRPGPIRAQQDELTAVAAGLGVGLSAWPAQRCKTWATDRRLTSAGLMNVTAGQRHARDGGRPALYAAVHDCGLPDPQLSRRPPAHEMTTGPVHVRNPG